MGIVLFAYADGFQPVGAAGVLLSLVSAIGIAMYKVSNAFHCNNSIMLLNS